MRHLVLILVAGVLVGCGGNGSSRAAGYRTPVLFATGPLQQACQASGRTSANQARCGCIQAVANRSLSASDQRRGAGFFNDPAALQDVRQSDSAANERFWLAWKAYGAEAAALCEAT